MIDLTPAIPKPQAFYIHIPFCLRKCFYCDFAITTGKAELQEHYVDVLCVEIALTAQNQNLAPLNSIFWGGGTPSLLQPRQIGRILDTINSYWAIATNAEISLEANPGTVTEQSLRGYKSLGINRLSLGAQAFQDRLLDLCGRGHGVAEIYEAIAFIKSAGFENFSLDLISGLPTQTLDDWQASLESAIALEPKHISVYDLTIEPSTAFYKRYRAGASPLPTEETTVEMFLLARDRLQRAGYKHYEISNYAFPTYQSRQNLVYWHNQPFYGVGMGATSYVNHWRLDRPQKLRDYLGMVQAWSEGKVPMGIKIGDCEELFDTLMQGLRLYEGVSLDYLILKFGLAAVQEVLAKLEIYRRNKWVNVTSTHLILTQPEGWLFSDVIIGDLFEYFSKDFS
jgi:putative oxygen-independent coproporphyrinogen III oxidase